MDGRKKYEFLEILERFNYIEKGHLDLKYELRVNGMRVSDYNDFGKEYPEFGIRAKDKVGEKWKKYIIK